MLFAGFCFLAYYFSVESENNLGMPEQTGEVFFFMGMVIIVISILLVFVMHMSTRVNPQSLIIDGLWTARKVKIDLHAITKVEKVKYSKYPLNRPKYNLHRKGKIKFYVRGNDAVQLTDRDGLKYIIGTQRADELVTVLKDVINKLG